LTDPEVPEPPDPATLDPLVKLWSGGADLWRVHKLDRRPAEFNPGVDIGPAPALAARLELSTTAASHSPPGLE
jgi:hypothetical protein